MNAVTMKKKQCPHLNWQLSADPTSWRVRNSLAIWESVNSRRRRWQSVYGCRVDSDVNCIWKTATSTTYMQRDMIANDFHSWTGCAKGKRRDQRTRTTGRGKWTSDRSRYSRGCKKKYIEVVDVYTRMRVHFFCRRSRLDSRT